MYSKKKKKKVVGANWWSAGYNYYIRLCHTVTLSHTNSFPWVGGFLYFPPTALDCDLS